MKKIGNSEKTNSNRFSMNVMVSERDCFHSCLATVSKMSNYIITGYEWFFLLNSFEVEYTPYDGNNFHTIGKLHHSMEKCLHQSHRDILEFEVISCGSFNEKLAFINNGLRHHQPVILFLTTENLEYYRVHLDRVMHHCIVVGDVVGSTLEVYDPFVHINGTRIEQVISRIDLVSISECINSIIRVNSVQIDQVKHLVLKQVNKALGYFLNECNGNISGYSTFLTFINDIRVLAKVNADFFVEKTKYISSTMSVSVFVISIEYMIDFIESLQLTDCELETIKSELRTLVKSWKDIRYRLHKLSLKLDQENINKFCDSCVSLIHEQKRIYSQLNRIFNDERIS
jgi:hypothetical protein